MRRFPTIAVEEQRPGIAAPPVRLYATPAPPLPPHVVEAVARGLSESVIAPPSRGLPELREVLAAEIAASTGRAVDPGRELLLTNGAMHALSIVFRSLLSPGDEAVVPAPCFFFEEPIRRAGGVPVLVHGHADEGWRWDADSLAAAIGPRARLLVLCNPVNPTGRVPSPEEVAGAVAVAERAGLLVLTDEAYERFLWEGAELASAFPLAERVLLVRSLGKSLAMPHLRLGLVAGPEDLVRRCLATLEWDCIRVGIAGQIAAHAALSEPRAWLDAVYEQLARDRETALDLLSEVPELDAPAPEGGPFVLLSTREPSPVFARQLLEVGLPVVDGRHFHAPGTARLPFGGATALRSLLRRALDLWRLASSSRTRGPSTRGPSTSCR